ncbi:PA14 domain-containing protein [Streptomyces sp. NPDC090108]|uniref:PA14 domain-containing protein n=1 Tax=Streptomyces sp. NPDC090108 TaxID=3365947 RepID=UPI003818DCF3
MKPARLATATAVALATAGGLLHTAAAPASATTGCASPVYTRAFYTGTAFSGSPKKKDCDSSIAENWGTGAPAAGLPKDNFGVRWTVTRDFGSGGPFSLPVAAQDGVRVYLDGVRKIDVWKNVSATVKKTADITIPAGRHTLRVDYVNWTGAANIKFAYTPRTSSTVDKVRPLTPTAASVTYDPKSSKAKLTWARNPEMDLAGYRVYVRAKGHDDWHLTSGGTLTTTSFTNALPPNGASSYYEVRAVDKAGNESGGTHDLPVTTADRTAPDVPVLTATDDDYSGVLVAWDDAWEPGARYDVFRASSATGEFVRIRTLNGVSSIGDETAPYGETSYYRVVATDAAGNTSRSAVLAHTRRLPVPYLLDAGTNADESGVELRWTMPLRAETQYRVYRREASGDNAAEVRIDCEPSRVGPADDPIATYACTDRSAVPETAYWYRVTSVGAGGQESKSSQVQQGGLYDRTPPPPVTGLTSTATEYGTDLEWEASPAPDVAEYDVFRAPADHPTEDENIARLAPGTTRFTDLDVPDGENWVYYVAGTDTSSNTLWETSPRQVARTEAHELDLTPAATLPDTAGLTLSARTDGTGHAALSWTARTAGAATATGFHVYRWDRAAGQYVRLTDVPLGADAHGYTDAATPAGTTGYYVVSVVAPDGTEAFSGLAPVVVPPSGA